MRALVSAVLAGSIVALLLVAGCSMYTGGGTGGGNGGGSGSGTGSSMGANDKNMKAYFTVDCTMTRVDVSPDYTDTWTTKMNGDIPFQVERNWKELAALSQTGSLYYGYGLSGGETKLDINSEWTRTCKKQPCTPCHFVYKGPVGLGATIQHNLKDAPADWTAHITGIGTPTGDSLSEGKLDQYTTSLDPACQMDKHIETSGLYGNSEICFGPGETKPFTFGDNSIITWTSNDPEVTLDSTAVFHILTTSTPVPTVSLATLQPEPTVSLATLQPTKGN
jgi:hypothetical protein